MMPADLFAQLNSGLASVQLAGTGPADAKHDGQFAQQLAGTAAQPKSGRGRRKPRNLPRLPLAKTSAEAIRKNNAAGVITRTMRAAVAAPAYQRMLSSGSIWRRQPVASIEALSAANMSRLRQSLGVLSEQETAFLDNALRVPFYATHFTNSAFEMPPSPAASTDAALRSAVAAQGIVSPRRGGTLIGQRGDIALFSKVQLESRVGIEFRSKTQKVDIARVGHDDFVFFSIEPGDKPKKAHSRFGKNKIRIPMDTPSIRQGGWISLDDMAYPNRPQRNGLAKWVSEPELMKIYGLFCNGQDRVFHGKDMVPGLLLSLVSDFRQCLEPKGQSSILSARDEHDLNLIINGFYRPELKVPRHVFVPAQTFSTECTSPVQLGELMGQAIQNNANASEGSYSSSSDSGTDHSDTGAPGTASEIESIHLSDTDSEWDAWELDQSLGVINPLMMDSDGDAAATPMAISRTATPMPQADLLYFPAPPSGSSPSSASGSASGSVSGSVSSPSSSYDEQQALAAELLVGFKHDTGAPSGTATPPHAPAKPDWSSDAWANEDWTSPDWMQVD